MLLWVLSCRDRGTVEYRHRVQLKDSIDGIVKDYVRENNVRINEVFITLKHIGFNNRRLLLTNVNSRTYDTLFVPSAYSVVDDSIIVLIYSGIESYYNHHNSIIEELDLTFHDLNIVLKPIGSKYDAPTWIATDCNGEIKISKKQSPFIVTELPCNYLVKRDSLKLDSLFLTAQ